VEIKYNVVSRLINNQSVDEIANELEIPKTTVMRMRREFEKARANDQLHEFIDMDKVLLDQLTEQMIDNSPLHLQDDVIEHVAEIKQAKTLLDALSEDMVITAKALTTRIKSMSSTIEHVSELEGLANALANLNKSFFQDQRTQVNVQNNFGGESPAASYGAFLSDKPSNN